MKRSRSTTWYLELPSDAYNSWGELHTSIEVSEERRRLWNGWKNTMYSDRGVQSYAPWAIVVDPKDGRKKLRVTATMKKADQWGGLAVRDYTVRVTLRSRPDLGIRTGGSTFADAQFSLGAVARQTVLAGSPAVYLVRAHVQGPVPLQLRFHGSAGGAGWTARYFDAPMGGNDITSQITGAGWLSTLIQGGASTPEIRVEVTPSTGISTGAERLIRVWATSANGAAGQDVVESLTKVGTPEKPIP